MCGLTGYITPFNRELDTLQIVARTEIFKDLLELMDFRGGHATGVFVGDKYKQGAIIKDTVDASLFLKENSYGIDWQSEIILGHTRFATHGNANKIDNAHPWRYGNLVGMHNGVIYNYKELAEQNGLVIPEVDSQVLFGLMGLQGWTPDRLLEEIEGTATIVWHDKESNTVQFARHDNPLTLYRVPELGNTIFYASTKKALDLTFTGTRLETHVIEMDDLDILTVNLEDGEIDKTHVKKVLYQYGSYTASLYRPTLSDYEMYGTMPDNDAELLKKTKEEEDAEDMYWDMVSSYNPPKGYPLFGECDYCGQTAYVKIDVDERLELPPSTICETCNDYPLG